MAFSRSDIRRAMDVYTSDNVYLGTVLETVAGPPVTPGELVPADAHEGSTISGELLGPMPTQPLGNPGPATQSARAGYATSPAAAPLDATAIVVGRWWGLIGRRTIPLSAVQTVSMERVVLRWTRDELARAAGR